MDLIKITSQGEVYYTDNPEVVQKLKLLSKLDKLNKVLTSLNCPITKKEGL